MSEVVTPHTAQPPLLRVEGVSRSHWRGPRQVRVLEDVTLDVAAGDLVAVYGRRGAGKTTLLRIAAGFERSERGRVLLGGRDLALLPRRELARVHRHEIAWVERTGPHSRELPLGVYVSLPLYREHGPAEARRRAATALGRVGAADCAACLWEDISDTARMLVAIAEALVREPRLLVVDDPTAGLGIVDRERVVGILRSAAEDGGLGVLMAVPDMPAMLQAHQLRALSRGRLLAPSEPSPGSDGGDVVELPRRRLHG